MKKLFFLIGIMAFVLLMFGCAINTSMGAISVTNATGATVKNIKIGTTTLSASLQSGGGTTHPFYASIKGKLSADGVEKELAQTLTDSELTLLLDYGYGVTISTVDGKNYFNVTYFKRGADLVQDAGDIVAPWD